MIELYGLTNRGIEDVAALEAKELGASRARACAGFASFSCAPEKIPFLVHMTQSMSRVLVKAGEGKAESVEEVVKSIDIEGLGKLFSGLKSFRVECERTGTHSFSSEEVERKVGALIKEKHGLSVSLDNPGAVLHVSVREEQAVAGIDLAGFDLSKREYKVFSVPASIKASIGYAALRLSSFTGKESFADVFCGDGVIPIEAALFSLRISPRSFFKGEYAFEKLPLMKEHCRGFRDAPAETKKGAEIMGFDSLLRNVDSAKKNAKIAGVNKAIEFSRAEIEWLDTKLDKESVECLATKVPESSKHVKESKTRKNYRELFYQAEYFLKKRSTVSVLCDRPELALENAEKQGFVLEGKREVWQGKKLMNLLVFKKS